MNGMAFRIIFVLRQRNVNMEKMTIKFILAWNQKGIFSVRLGGTLNFWSVDATAVA